MDLRRLKTFVTVAEHGTVSKAAEVLHITQPALSRQIGGLEQELGFELFQRAGRRLLLTPRGEQLLGDCRSLLAHAGTVGERAQALRRGELKVLRVATSALTIEGLFPIFLHRYAERFPGVRLALIEADAAEHLTMLEQGEADLAISVLNVVPVDEHRFASYLLPLFQMLAACAPTFDIAETDTIEIRRLVQHPLLLPNPSYATRNVFDAACRLAGVRPNVLVESSAAHALLALAEEGHGVAVIPSVLRTDRSPVRIMRVTHRREPLHITVAVLWDRRRTLPHYAEGFSELLAAHVREMYPTPRPARLKVVAARASAGTKRTR
ncbi:MAG: LysR family transcriptional regulator [Xanthobacteraceae bacterium]|jgi:DNA-binding transcriptional LysR family regulator